MDDNESGIKEDDLEFEYEEENDLIHEVKIKKF